MSAQQVIELQMNNISIAFPGVQALKEVNFHTVTGRSHALIGANGAGKSTLMKVLSGAYVHYTGQILMDGTEVHIRSPKDAKELGIQIVYQEVDTALIPNLTVGENMMLDTMVHDMKGKQFMSWRKLHREAQEVLNRIHVQVSSKQLVQELTLAQKQMVLIARAISRACKFLILDEPTAPLSHAETEELFRIVRMLKQEQVGIIFISHRLPELFQICDDITIMRDGEFIMREQIASMTQSEVVDQMLGRSLGEQYPKTQVELGPIQLELKQFTDREKIEPIDLYARKGEIVGIAGLVGAGKTELCKALFGASVMTAGEVLLNGKRLSIHSPHEAVKLGFALVPEERRKEGIWISESVTINLSAASLGQFTRMRTWLRSKRERASARKMIQSLGIKTPHEEAKVQHLSGGNQQKIAIGKWLITDADVYIFDEPTKGVDIGAKKDIFEFIFQLAQRGKCILYATCELSEIIGITDRTYVLYDGQVAKELITSQTNEEELLFYSTGGIEA